MDQYRLPDVFKALNILIQPITCTQGSVVIQLQPLCHTVFYSGKKYKWSALLLIPSNGSTTEHRRIDFDGIEYIMKPGHPRLSKNLTLGEFIVAFGKYKNIKCEVKPHRRTELDQYGRDAVENGKQFWLYLGNTKT